MVQLVGEYHHQYQMSKKLYLNKISSYIVTSIYEVLFVVFSRTLVSISLSFNIEVSDTIVSCKDFTSSSLSITFDLNIFSEAMRVSDIQYTILSYGNRICTIYYNMFIHSNIRTSMRDNLILHTFLFSKNRF